MKTTSGLNHLEKNYNSQAEKSSKIKGMKSIAKFLKEELLLLNNIRVVA